MTLMEVLLTATLVSIIGVAVFQAFNNGVKLWARSKGLDRDLAAAMFLERVGDDLRSTVTIAGVPFKGTGARFSFPAVVWTPADRRGARSAEGLVDQVGAIEYYYDDGAKIVYRRQANYSQALKRQWGDPQEAAASVEGLAAYYYFSGNNGMQARTLADGAVPAGIMLEMSYRNGTGEHRLKRFFPVPVGG